VESQGQRSLARTAFAAATLASLAFGCGPSEPPTPPTVPVRGKVTYQGQPVPKGTVTYQPTSGRPASGEIQPDGTYQLSTFGSKDGAVAGTYKIIIIANSGDPSKMPSTPGYVPPKDLVPKKYSSLETSGLEMTVSEDKTSYDLDLK
jgi:hypothetical protein